MTASVIPAGVEGSLLTPGSPEWLRSMSASKIAAAMGLSPYDSPFSLWHKMAGLVHEEPSDEMRRGHYLEPAVAQWWADRHPEFDVRASGTWSHPDRPWQIASPDRMLCPHDDTFDEIQPPTAILECKTAADVDDWGDEGTDEIPVGYRAQVLWQMDTIGVDTCHVAVLLPYLQFREYLVRYDAAEAAVMRTVALDFLGTLERGERPDIDAHTSTYQAIRALHPDIDPVDIDLAGDLARQYCTARTVLATAKDADQLARALVLDAMGTARRACFDGHVIATRQPNGTHPPKLVAGRKLPSFDDLTERSAA